MRQTVYKKLPCDLTQEEVSIYSNELASITTTQSEIEAEKKEVMSDFTAKLNKCLADARVLARKITTRKEDREVECDLVFDYTRGMVFVVRTDTDVTIDQRKMSDHEKQEAFDFEKREAERQEAEDAAAEQSAAPVIDGEVLQIEHKPEEPTEGVMVCNNDGCEHFKKDEPNGCSFMEYVYECGNAIGEVVSLLDDDETTTETGPETAEQTEEIGCSLSPEEIARRGDICGDWITCEYQDLCFTPQNEQDGICFKDSEARAAGKTEPDSDGVVYDKIEQLNVAMADKLIKNHRIQIRVVQGDSGNWYCSYHLHAPNRGGHTYLPFPKFSEKYTSRNEAIKAACELIYNKVMDTEDNKIVQKIGVALSDFMLTEVQ